MPGSGDAGESGEELECTGPTDYDGFAEPFFSEHCLDCHSAALEGSQRFAAPVGVDFDTEADVIAWQPRIAEVVLIDRTMPPGVALDACERSRLESYLASLPPSDDCTPLCAGLDCGDDGCGGSCGTCPDGTACNEFGVCECAPDCGDRECGDDGCGGSCGTCETLTCNTHMGICTDDCTPDCNTASCGDDGCGGSCGDCGTDQRCVAGTCEDFTATFSEVFALFESFGCGTSNCHGGMRPAEDLDLSTEATALNELTNKLSEQCANMPLVAAGAPEESYLINKLTGSGMCSGSRMPKSGSGLSAEQIDIVRAWINGL